MYTQLSHRALARARNEARHLNIGLTDTGHLLLALAQEKKALARKLLERAGIPRGKMEDHIERFYRRSVSIRRRSTTKTPPISNSLFLALDWAEEESLHGGHELIGTPQLMLGLLKLESSSACRVLRRLGLNTKAVKALIEVLHGEMETAEAQPSVQWFLAWYLKQQISQTRANAYNAFPSRSLRSLLLKAKERALLQGMEYANPLHVLGALLEEDSGTLRSLKEAKIPSGRLRENLAVFNLDGTKTKGFSLRSGMILLDPVIKSALSWAHGAACERGEHAYGPLNLLSALLADEQGIAAELFRLSGLEPGRVRRMLKRRLERQYPSNN